MNHFDRAELDRFALYCRLINEAQKAGVPGDEAARAIYHDVYEKQPTDRLTADLLGGEPDAQGKPPGLG